MLIQVYFAIINLYESEQLKKLQGAKSGEKARKQKSSNVLLMQMLHCVHVHSADVYYHVGVEGRSILLLF